MADAFWIYRITLAVVFWTWQVADAYRQIK
jgi:hypothetical protein